jgi:hypothetical protein
MLKYRSKSWSQSARQMCEDQISEINTGWQTIEGAVKFFHDSYRADIIKRRAAKMFGKALKANKVHEDLELYNRNINE